MRRFTLIASLVALVAVPVALHADTSVRGRSASVIRSQDEVMWEHGAGPACDCGVPSCGAPACGAPSCGAPSCGPVGCGAPIGCSTPVCYGYDSCGCRKCPGILCALRRLPRMLDSLLPCNKCCPGGCVFGCGDCGGCGNVSCSDVVGCRPRLFSRRKACGGCALGCSSCCPSCVDGVPGMMQSDGAMLSDPFTDDPAQPSPPKPTPEATHGSEGGLDPDAPPAPSKEVRKPVFRSPYAAHMTRATAQNFGAFKISANPRPTATAMPVMNKQIERGVAAAARKPAMNVNVQKVEAKPATSTAKAATKSVLRRASLEQEVEAVEEVETTDEPLLLPAIEIDNADSSVPANPLRR